MRTSTLLLALLALATGCVSASRYDELDQKYARARAQLAERNVQIRSLEQALADQEAEAQRLQTELDEGRAWIGALEAEVAQSGKLVSDRDRLAKATEQLKQALAGLALRKAEADRRVAEYRDMLVRFKGLIDAGTLSVRVVDGRMVLALPTDVLFDSGSARLSKTGKQAVQQVGAVLSTMNRRRIQIEGHTDDVPIRTAQFPSNWELASARALVVVREMMQAGVPSATLSAASYGEFHPVASNADPNGRTLNRRIEVVLLPDLSTLPGFDELQHAVSQP